MEETGGGGTLHGRTTTVFLAVNGSGLQAQLALQQARSAHRQVLLEAVGLIDRLQVATLPFVEHAERLLGKLARPHLEELIDKLQRNLGHLPGASAVGVSLPAE